MRHTEAQMDFILEMHLKDHPDEYTLRRGVADGELTAAETMAQWENRLTGKARERFLGITLPSPAVFKRIKEMSMATDLIRRVAETRRDA